MAFKWQCENNIFRVSKAQSCTKNKRLPKPYNEQPTCIFVYYNFSASEACSLVHHATDFFFSLVIAPNRREREKKGKTISTWGYLKKKLGSVKEDMLICETIKFSCLLKEILTCKYLKSNNFPFEIS